jgi:hypothetical protein
MISWKQLVSVAAAAAGGAAWVSAVGSGVVALRLRRAGLPVEPVVALMSNEHRFAIGAGILIAPVFAGFVGFLADWVLAGELVTRPHTLRQKLAARFIGVLPGRAGAGEELPHVWRQVLAAFTVIIGMALAGFMLEPPWQTILTEGVFVLAAVFLALQFLKPESRHTFREQFVMFLSVLVAAGIGAVVAERWRSPSFDDVSITAQAGTKPVTGGYITSTDQAVVVATKCTVIEAVPRTQIVRIIVGPGRFRC